MKKTILCIILVILNVFSSSALSMASESETIKTYTFNKYSSGDIPDGFTVSQGSFVNIYNESEKGLQLPIGERVSSFSGTEKIDGNYSIAFDLYTGAETFSLNLEIKDKSGNVFKPVSIDSSGAIKTYDGKKVAVYKKGVVNRIAVGVNVELGRYGISLNGKKVIGCWRYSAAKLSGIASYTVSLSSSEKSKTAIADNIVINSSPEPQKVFVKDPVIIEDGETAVVPEDDAKDRIYMCTDFENGDPTAVYGFKGYDNIARYQEDNGNWAKIFERVSDTRNVYTDIYINNYTSGKLVVEYDIKLADLATSAALFVMRDSSAVFETCAQINSGKFTAGGKSVSLGKDKWYNVACVMDFITHKYDVYFDGEVLAENVSFAKQNFGWPILTRISITQATNVKFLVDNIFIYGGDTIRDFTPEEIEELAPKQADSVFPSDADIAEFAGTSVMLHMKSGVMCRNSEKEIVKNSPYYENGVAMVPLRELSEFMGYKIRYDSETSVAYVDDHISYSAGSDIMNTENGAELMDAAATLKDGTLYVPLASLAKGIGKKMQIYDSASWNSGLAVISDEKFNVGSRLEELNQFAFFYRPNAATILNDFKQTGTSHPYLFGKNSDYERIKNLMLTDERVRSGVSYSVSNSDKSAIDAAMAYCITGKIDYAQKAYNHAKDLIDNTVWTTEQYLMVGEKAAKVGIVYDLTYEALNDEQRKYLEEGLYRQALAPTLSIYKGESGSRDTFAIRENNWNAVCNGGVSVGAMAMLGVYPDECAQIISFASRALEYTIDNYAPDGAWYEGPGYWNYGTSYLVWMLAAMESTLGTDYMIHKTEGLDKAAEFFLMNESGEGMFNFADSEMPSGDFAGSSVDSCVFWLLKKYNRPDLMQEYVKRFDFAGQTKPSNISLLWYEPTLLSGTYQLKKDSYYRVAEVVTMSSNRKDSNASFVGFKGGYSSREHSHLDLGSFVFDSMGTRWAIDLGSENYNVSEYWDRDGGRWKTFRTRAASHNTLVINPSKNYPADQKLTAFAPVTKLDSKDKGAIGIVDLTSAYADDASSVRRGFYFADDRRSLVIRDELDVKSLSEIYWLMYTDAEDVSINGNTALIAKDGKVLKFEYIAEGGTLAVEDAVPLSGTPALRDEENKNMGIKRLVIKLNKSGKINITVKLTPYTLTGSSISDYDKPMDMWRVPDGENFAEVASYEPIMLDSIEINGEQIEGFESGKFNYTRKEYEGYLKNHTVTAISADHDVEVLQGETEGEPTQIIVTDRENPHIFSAYAIYYDVVPNLIYFDGYTDIKPESVEVSAVPQPENGPNMMLDRSLDTRWSAEGKEQWALFDFGKICTFDKMKMAFYQGNKRKQNMRIEVSEDGISYTEIFNGASCGETAGLEDFDFASVNARFVRIEFNQTSTGTWNSPSEVIFLKKND